ncbi:hypothetical protein CONPUDRAFT_159692 [Coniophora puteana RWD-64-598 SS2]|uniref:Uncharacterized protein n=1 Tax=Coniophora puteana (strain RWD-64-598) TaxID=741705 RepID=A0A5M3M801_CONPW|nr:uncharacterized protein CONPUDRAFT_159692 [Coniophora puteana RWD-64-598 SS2]EIW74920.1 hypothetical protein CONPUDRAFT_159692 [Coniophora puteana RWD-64-598 SS2]
MFRKVQAHRSHATSLAFGVAPAPGMQQLPSPVARMVVDMVADLDDDKPVKSTTKNKLRQYRHAMNNIYDACV